MKYRRGPRRGGRGSKRKFGPEPTAASIKKETKSGATSTKRTFQFVMVLVRFNAQEFKDLMRGKLAPEACFPEIKEAILASRWEESLGQLKLKPMTAAFLVPYSKGEWKRPQIRCVNIDGTEWSHYTRSTKK